MHTVIFTDLDGTLLDHHTYSFDAAKPALAKIRQLQIPLVIASSKTRFELLTIRKQLQADQYPFVVENGSAIYTAPEYFEIPLTPEFRDGLWCYRMGKTFMEIKTIIETISREYDHSIRGFHNATMEEVAASTGLSGKALRNAMFREFTIPLFHDKETESILKDNIRHHDLQILYGGRFMHIVGDVDKGHALNLIISGFKQKYHTDQVRSVAIGDSQNDFSMLEAADIGILVKKHDGTYETRAKSPNITLSPFIGPKGWNTSVLELMKSGGFDE